MPAAMSASVLCAPLLDGPTQPLYVVHSSSAAFQLADRHGSVRVCVADSSAVRLPHALTLARLPLDAGHVAIGGGLLHWGTSTYRVARWWSPPRPVLPALREKLHEPALGQLRTDWESRLGRGGGLTPYGDDVVCGALVTALASRAPSAKRWAAEVAAAPLERRTTATSAALLRLATGGWCVDAVAGYLRALASGVGVPTARARLLSVGSSSGRGLLEGIDGVCARAARAAA